MNTDYKKLALIITSIAGLIITIISIFSAYNERGFQEESDYYIVVTFTFISIMILTSLFQILYFTNKNPVSITLSLLGFPKVGKTVYLTILFEELQKSRENYINFSPYGSETIEKVMNDINTLRNNSWLPRTSINKVFYYRALATLNPISPILLNKKKFKIEIADYAGEHLYQFNPQTENWLHKTEYFQYVLDSNAIFLALDIEKLINDEEFYQKDIDGLIVAIQILAEKKGAIFGKKAEEPIAILFLKSDLLNDKINVDYVIDNTERLILICINRFQNVKHFFVSSTGKLIYGELTSRLEPKNVVEPLIWLLRNSKIN